MLEGELGDRPLSIAFATSPLTVSNMRADGFVCGTLSAPNREGWGSLPETTRGGTELLRLASGEERRFLEDGDEVVMTPHAYQQGFVPIGFGKCRGTITAGPRSA
jgi:hypothetical protein